MIKTELYKFACGEIDIEIDKLPQIYLERGTFNDIEFIQHLAIYKICKEIITENYDKIINVKLQNLYGYISMYFNRYDWQASYEQNGWARTSRFKRARKTPIDFEIECLWELYNVNSYTNDFDHIEETYKMLKGAIFKYKRDKKDKVNMFKKLKESGCFTTNET